MPRAKRGSSTDSATPEPLNADTTEPTSDAVAPPTATAAPEAPKRRTARRTVKAVEEAIPADPGTGHLTAQPEAGPPAETAGAEAVKPKSRRPRGKTTENLLAVSEAVPVTPEEPPAVPKRRRGTKAEATVLAGGAIVEFEAPEPVETDSTRTAQAAKAPISIPSVETEADTASHRNVVIGGREVEIITSLDNDKVRYVRSLHEKRSRDAENAFIIEGVRLVEEALGAGAEGVFAVWRRGVSAT